MDYLVVATMGLICGAFGGWFLWEPKRIALNRREQALESRKSAIDASRQKLKAAFAAVEQAQGECNKKALDLERQGVELLHQIQVLKDERSRFLAEADLLSRQVVTYRDLENENELLKGDLRNIEISVRRGQLDCEAQRDHQMMLDAMIKDVGSRYLKDTVKWVGATLNPNNFASSRQRIVDVIERCRKAGLQISNQEEASLVSKLKEDYEKVVRAAVEREVQGRIKAQIREEQLRQREIDRELSQLERERNAIEAAIRKALDDAHGQHSEEVERLEERLAEAEARSQRAISQAQLTKAGFVYIISNIGSFGENVFKIGMTRRLEPMERVRELGGASVPFPFDVHAMISCDDAPSLENALHRRLYKRRLNKTNPRKEFFRADIEEILSIVEEHHGEVEYVVDVDAMQYRQSVSMADEDNEFIEQVYKSVDDDEDVVVDDY